MKHNNKWKPQEIIVNEKIADDPVTLKIFKKCPEVPIRYASSGSPGDIVKASTILSSSNSGMLNKILAGKKVMYIAPAANDTVDEFTMPDDRMICPHFTRLKLGSNSCPFSCDWCYLKLTYRAQFPYITVRSEYPKIMKQIRKRTSKAKSPVLLNSGELADSMALEHLTGAAKYFIPRIGRMENARLFMLTKAYRVNPLIKLKHQGNTIVAWSINAPEVTKRFELRTPSLKKRLIAARRVQEAGYPVRIRLDPIVPIPGWKKSYKKTVQEIFDQVSPERITLGTLRFEEGFYNIRNSIFTTGEDLPRYLNKMKPMFPPKIFPGSNKPKKGKYSFTDTKRIKIFDFVINEIQKCSSCDIALCKESAEVWDELGLDLHQVKCVCQSGSVDMTQDASHGMTLNRGIERSCMVIISRVFWSH
jgi:spore photoproduct lyase